MTSRMSARQLLPRELCEAIDTHLDAHPRVILGLAGSPGAGKSSAAAAIAAAYDHSVVVPMDGFHLAQMELTRLGREDRKGAPDTFDAAGYISLLNRIRNERQEIVYAPEFRREIEEPIAGAIPIVPSHRLIVTEGNYLLMGGAWSAVRPLLDVSVFVEIAPELRVTRLIDRHMAFGRSRDAATEWVMRSDEKNARLIEETRIFAQFGIRWPAG